MTTQNTSINELQTLLDKHGASISWACHWSSDLHGVTGQCMEITQRGKGTVLTIDGNTVSAYDIKQSKD
jgi:hypothetical protein